jgi:SAM-dependent MidA family methyltransferase
LANHWHVLPSRRPILNELLRAESYKFAGAGAYADGYQNLRLVANDASTSSQIMEIEMENDDRSKFVAQQLSGLSAVLLALIRTLEESEVLKRQDLIAVLNEFRDDMTVGERESGEGFMIERFVDALADAKLTRFEFD